MLNNTINPLKNHKENYLLDLLIQYAEKTYRCESTKHIIYRRTHCLLLLSKDSAKKKEVSKRMYFLGYRISENRITLCIKKIFFKIIIQKTMTEQSTVFEVSHGAL